jgi:hypothetical protein
MLATFYTEAHMRRRTFLETAGLGVMGSMVGGALASGCAESSTIETADAASAMGDTLVQLDAANAIDAPGAAYVVQSAFSVMLNDSSCSGHDHGCDVVPMAYADDSPVSFLGGSHLVQFRPSELVRLERGEMLAFATNGPGPGHGHCGMAFRVEIAQPSRTRMDGCHILPPESGPMAICELHPST